MVNIRASKKMNEKKKVPQRGLGIAQLERIRLEEQHKKDVIFQTIQCPKFIPTSSRIDFSSKDCVFTPNHHGVVFGHNLNLPSVNISSGISSSVHSSQMERPSNQSYYGCKCLPHWPEEVKVAAAEHMPPSRLAAAEHMPPSRLSTSAQQPILGFFPSAKVQIGREGTRGSDFQTEVGRN
ncbi:hypothetical protein H5410_052164, partial [Solanum commersonii]